MEERNDFDWLVTILEVQKRNRRVRHGRAYAARESASQDVEQWKQRQRRNRVVLAIYATILFLSIVLSLVLH